jgi:hypothetical protein
MGPDALKGFGPVGTNGPTDTPAEVAKALARVERTCETEDSDHLNGLESHTIRAHIANLERQIAEAREEGEARLRGERAAHEVTRKALAEATETWTDEAGTVWCPPTAWAYAQACRALENAKSQLAAQRERDGRDAERWRFVRKWWGRLCDVYVGDGPEVDEVYIDETNGWLVDAETLDAAIDAALKDRP